MGHKYLETVTTPAVAEAQDRYGGRDHYDKLIHAAQDRNDRFGPNETAFIEARDGFYLATVSETGWPYVQFRGGPRGFLKALDETTLGWADFRGNRQYVSVGNLARTDKASLFLMDYVNRRRLKILGHLSVEHLDESPEAASELEVRGYPAFVERAMRLKIVGFDWNCPQHIPQRFTLEELEAWALARRGD